MKRESLEVFIFFYWSFLFLIFVPFPPPLLPFFPLASSTYHLSRWR